MHIYKLLYKDDHGIKCDCLIFQSLSEKNVFEAHLGTGNKMASDLACLKSKPKEGHGHAFFGKKQWSSWQEIKFTSLEQKVTKAKISGSQPKNTGLFPKFWVNQHFF